MPDDTIDPKPSTSIVVQLHREPSWYTAQQLAEKLGVTARTIYRRVERGLIQKIQTHEGIRFRPTPVSETPVDTTDVKDPLSKTVNFDRCQTMSTSSCQKVSNPGAADVKSPLSQPVNDLSRQSLTGRLTPSLTSVTEAVCGPGYKQYGPVHKQGRPDDEQAPGSYGVVELAGLLAQSEFKRGLIESENVRLRAALASLEQDHERLWDVVGELTDEMIELERQLALATGEVLDSQR